MSIEINRSTSRENNIYPVAVREANFKGSASLYDKKVYGLFEAQEDMSDIVSNMCKRAQEIGKVFDILRGTVGMYHVIQGEYVLFNEKDIISVCFADEIEGESYCPCRFNFGLVRKSDGLIVLNVTPFEDEKPQANVVVLLQTVNGVLMRA